MAPLKRAVAAALLLATTAASLVVVRPAVAGSTLWAPPVGRQAGAPASNGTCAFQTDDGINDDEVSYDCPRWAKPPAPFEPFSPTVQKPSAWDGQRLTGAYTFLRKPPTTVPDGVRTPCPATAVVAAGSLRRHASVDPITGIFSPPMERRVHFSMPASALALNGEPCTAPAIVGLFVSYDAPEEPAARLVAFSRNEATCRGWGGPASVRWVLDSPAGAPG
eukprot:TRINITY_DN3014_c0_g1_i8.p1 TRINITY_DN3014_c0_g1~~TRINITY_DN3014_c0_g1_i8.p1  ORF type:complete len:220 (-),score=48.48 TRINITY_DN3014_c0_g1_i8:422-1081(-)